MGRKKSINRFVIEERKFSNSMSEGGFSSPSSQLPTPSEKVGDDRSDNNGDSVPVMSSSTSGAEPEHDSMPSVSSSSHYSFDEQYFVEPTTPFRVLCLHDELSNAGELSGRFSMLGQRLYDNHAIELVFINSPLLARTSDKSKKSGKSSTSESSTTGDQNDDDENDVDENTIQSKNARIWWEEVSATSAARWSTNTSLGTRIGEGNKNDDDSDKNDSDTKENQTPSSSSSSPIHGDHRGNGDDNEASTTNASDNKHYLGLDASLLLLRQIWSSQPFWGILAVGQGASVAMFLALLPDISHRPSFSIFVEGTTVLDDDEELLLDDDGNNAMPCLHILGVDPNENTQRLVRQFGGEVSSGVQSFSNVSMNRIGKVRRKRRSVDLIIAMATDKGVVLRQTANISLMVF